MTISRIVQMRIMAPAARRWPRCARLLPLALIGGKPTLKVVDCIDLPISALSFLAFANDLFADKELSHTIRCSSQASIRRVIT
eukprot:scaffold26748_cov18-Prasinocladus_malaysianus.AAC.1